MTKAEAQISLAKLKLYMSGGGVIDRKANEAIDMAIKALESPERNRGKWIWMGEKGDSRFMCSVCNSKEDVPTCNGEPTIWWFCPNCGADMREEIEDVGKI